MISFNSDYSEGMLPEILQKLVETNLEQTVGYGEDHYTLKAKEILREKLKAENAKINFLVGGTQTNLTVLSHILKTYESVISDGAGHIATHETGAIEATGHKVDTIGSLDGKITAEGLKKFLSADNFSIHNVKPRVVYISNSNEYGLIYSKAELLEIKKICKEYKLLLYIDGARLASAIASEKNDIELEEYKEFADILYIGATKAGAIFGEAVVFFNPILGENFEYTIKQKGALLAKGRFLGIQFLELFKDNLYEKVGEYSNKLAIKIKEAFLENGIEIFVDSYTNQQFPILSLEMVKKLREEFEFQKIMVLEDGRTVYRFVTSWATKDEDVKKLIAKIKEIA